MNARTRRTISWGALAVAAGLGVVAFWTMRARAALERELAAARAESARLATEWRARQQRPAPTHVAAVNAHTTAAVATEAPAPPAKPAFPARTRAPGLVDLARDNPQLWNEFLQAKRIELGRFFLPLMQRLNLTAAQRERLKDILESELARSSDIHTAGTAQGLAYEDPVLAKLRAESDAQRKRELVELLGAAGAKAFADFERATPMRGAVNGFAVQVARFAPLTSQQADQLERALAQANAAYQKGEHGLAQSLDWTEADRAARTILTPQQFDAWKLGVAHNSFGGPRLEQELHQVYNRAVDRAKRSGASDAPR